MGGDSAREGRGSWVQSCRQQRRAQAQPQSWAPAGQGQQPESSASPPHPPHPRQLQPAAGLTAWLLEGSDTRDIPHCGEPASQAQSRTEEGREQRGPSTTRGRAGFREGPEAEPEAGIGVTGLDVILGGT